MHIHQQTRESLPLSVSSSFVHGLSVSIQPLKALLSSVRSTVACGFPSWQAKLSDWRVRLNGLLKGSGNSLSGHSQTLQSRSLHIPSSGQKGQLHHSLICLRNKNIRLQGTRKQVIKHSKQRRYIDKITFEFCFFFVNVDRNPWLVLFLNLSLMQN